MKNIYYRIMWETVDKLNEETDKKELHKKILLHGVNAIVLDNEKPSCIEEVHEKFKLINLILRTMSEITPRELIQMFPIDKVYDGGKYECKDYFYTMRMIEDHGIDEKIKESFEFIMDYTNIKVRLFAVKVMGAMDNMRAFEGKQSIMGEFMAENGVTPYTIHTDHQGKEFMIKDGNTIKIEKPKKRPPKYMRLVK